MCVFKKIAGGKVKPVRGRFGGERKEPKEEPPNYRKVNFALSVETEFEGPEPQPAASPKLAFASFGRHGGQVHFQDGTRERVPKWL